MGRRVGLEFYSVVPGPAVSKRRVARPGPAYGPNQPRLAFNPIEYPGPAERNRKARGIPGEGRSRCDGCFQNPEEDHRTGDPNRTA